MSGIKMHRLGLVMEPAPGNPQEVEGVLNPAAARESPSGTSKVCLVAWRWIQVQRPVHGGHCCEPETIA